MLSRMSDDQRPFNGAGLNRRLAADLGNQTQFPKPSDNAAGHWETKRDEPGH